jgi:hypothetical protein
MSGPFGQIAMLVVWTCGLRALGRWAGPRWSGLLLGLPSTTALVLLGCALERGPEDAAGTAEACLAGLAASATLPLAYARAVSAGWPLFAAVVAAVAGYAAVVAGLWWLPEVGAAGCLAGAAAGVAVACRLAEKPWPFEGSATTAEAGTRLGPGRRPPSRGWVLATRAGVPAVCVLVVRALRAVAGSGWAGRFLTFPGGSLTLLVATHVEAGPDAARRLAATMPTGCLGTLAFLAVFRFGGPRLGLGWTAAAGYAAALSALLAAEALAGRREAARHPLPSRRWAEVERWFRDRGRAAWLRVDPAARGSAFPAGAGVGRSRVSRRFSPRLEALAG